MPSSSSGTFLVILVLLPSFLLHFFPSSKSENKIKRSKHDIIDVHVSSCWPCFGVWSIVAVSLCVCVCLSTTVLRRLSLSLHFTCFWTLSLHQLVCLVPCVCACRCGPSIYSTHFCKCTPDNDNSKLLTSELSDDRPTTEREGAKYGPPVRNNRAERYRTSSATDTLVPFAGQLVGESSQTVVQ